MSVHTDRVLHLQFLQEYTYIAATNSQPWSSPPALLVPQINMIAPPTTGPFRQFLTGGPECTADAGACIADPRIFATPLKQGHPTCKSRQEVVRDRGGSPVDIACDLSSSYSTRHRRRCTRLAVLGVSTRRKIRHGRSGTAMSCRHGDGVSRASGTVGTHDGSSVSPVRQYLAAFNLDV